MQITKTTLGDVSVTISDSPAGFTFIATDHRGDAFIEKGYLLLSDALLELHRFTMAEYAHSIYAKEADRPAFAPFI